jgi:hypothetical protein
VQADLRWGCSITRRKRLETCHNPHFQRLEHVNSRSSRGKVTCGFLESKLASRIVGAVERSESLKWAFKFPVQNDPVESGVKLLIALFASAFTLCQPAYGDGLSSDSGYDSSHGGWAIFELFHTIAFCAEFVKFHHLFFQLCSDSMGRLTSLLTFTSKSQNASDHRLMLS